MCIYSIYNTLSKSLHQVRTDRAAVAPSLMNKDLAPIFTTIHYSENTSTRYCTGVETCVYDSIATCVSAASFHCPEDSPTKVLWQLMVLFVDIPAGFPGEELVPDCTLSR